MLGVKQHFHSRARLQSNRTILEVASFCSGARISTGKGLVHSQSSLLEGGEHDSRYNKYAHDNSKSTTQLRKDKKGILAKDKGSDFEKRFANSKDNVGVVAINLKEYTRKLIQSKGKR